MKPCTVMADYYKNCCHLHIKNIILSCQSLLREQQKEVYYQETNSI